MSFEKSKPQKQYKPPFLLWSCNLLMMGGRNFNFEFWFLRMFVNLYAGGAKEGLIVFYRVEEELLLFIKK